MWWLDVAVQFGLTVSPEFAGVLRTLATIDGTVRVIDPTYTVVDGSRASSQAKRT